MTTNLPSLKSGSVGRVGFGHMNAVFDAVADYRAEAIDGGRRAGTRMHGRWVRLTAQVSVPPSMAQTAWHWEDLSRSVEGPISPDGTLLDSEGWEKGDGLAFEIGGDGAEVNDEVLIYPLPSADGKAWYAFASKVAQARRIEWIPVTGSGESPPFSYVTSVDGGSASAVNQYEQEPYGHGQPLSFDGLGGLVPAPVDGIVLATLEPDMTWRFDAPNPMVPQCAS